MDNKDKNNGDDQRSEFRLTDEITIFVELHSSPVGEDQQTNMAISKTIDVSANGLQIILDSPPPLHSVLRLYLETADDLHHFLLVGEVVRLLKVSASSYYQIGFRLLESDQTHIKEWKEYISQRLIN